MKSQHWVIYKLPGWILVKDTDQNISLPKKKINFNTSASHSQVKKQAASWDYLPVSGKL